MKLKKILLSSLLCLSFSDATAIQLSPNTNDSSGLLPTGHEHLTFQLSNGDWVKTIYLPWYGQEGDLITINSTATLASKISHSNLDVPDSFFINANQSFNFKHNAKTRIWELQFEKTLTPSQTPDFSQALPQWIVINDDTWVSNLRLPRSVADGSLLKVSSNTNKITRINREGMLFPSTFSLKKGETHWYRYNKSLNQWVPETITARQFDVKKVGAKMVTVNAAVTQVNFTNSSWVESLTLPSNAQDRDRIIVRSKAMAPAKINNTNINTNASLNVYYGSRYEFVFIEDLDKWVLISAPTTELTEDKLSKSQLDDTVYPVTKVGINQSNWQAEFKLPNKAQIDDKVIFESNASEKTQISSNNGLKAQLRNGETQRYIYTAKGWVADSHTLDLLLVLDPEVVAKIGESAAKLRLLSSIELTNLTAQNSNAQFYIRQAGMIHAAVPGDSIYKVLVNVLSIPAVKNERKRVGADMVYYESKSLDQGYCGLGYVPRKTIKPESMYCMLEQMMECYMALEQLTVKRF